MCFKESHPPYVDLHELLGALAVPGTRRGPENEDGVVRLGEWGSAYFVYSVGENARAGRDLYRALHDGRDPPSSEDDVGGPGYNVTTTTPLSSSDERELMRTIAGYSGVVEPVYVNGLVCSR